MNPPPGIEALRALVPVAADRERAFASFAELGWPTTRDEDWRFTHLRRLIELPFRAEVDSTNSTQTLTAAAEWVGPAHRIVFENGNLRTDLSALSGLPNGVCVTPLSSLSTEKIETLGRLADEKSRSLTALNRALFRNGAWVEITDNISLDRPIHIVDLVASGEDGLTVNPRHIYSLGAGSHVVLIEHTISETNAETFSNPVTEIEIGRDATLDHIKLQQDGVKAHHLAHLCARVESGGRLSQRSIALGGALSRFEILVELTGEGAHADLNGLYLSRGDQLHDHHTTIDHASPHTTSNEIYKGVINDKAEAVFHGRIHVRPHAQKTSASQSNRNMLLSDKASVHTKPQLEIYADDVQCSHGSTVGQLEDEHLFYLQSRGINAAEARALLTQAFAREVIEDLPITELREHIEGFILDWLPR